MRILFLTSSIGYGGAAKMMNFITDYLVGSCMEVVVLNLNSSETNIRGNFNQSLNPKIKIITRGEEYKSRLDAIKLVIKTVKEQKVDVMIAFTMFPNLYASIASRVTGIPSIISERGDPFRTFGNGIKDRFVRWIINKSKGAVFQTSQAGEFYSKALQKRAQVIPNPIFLPEGFEPPVVKTRERTVVSVGRFQNVQKRMDVMLKAFQLFSQKHPDYTLNMYGSGEDDYVRKLCRDLKIEDKVQLMGSVRNPITKIVNDGMFVITSDYEGIPNALLEAMSVGLPVISTDCSPGGARLLIRNNVNGQLVPIGDFHAVSDAMCRYAENSEFADLCGQNARQVLEDFSYKRIGEKWLMYIYNIVNNKKS